MQLFERIFGSGMTTLTISNEEMDHIMKIVKSLSAQKTNPNNKGVDFWACY